MKIKRHARIIELIKDEEVETQEELAQRLKDSGFEVTQATVSRDIRELKLTKITSWDGKQKYAVLSSVVSQFSERFLRIFRDGVVNLDHAQNLIVIKTLEGMAMAVAACIDAMGLAEILGCIAGDDTVFCAAGSERDAVNVIERLKEVLQG